MSKHTRGPWQYSEKLQWSENHRGFGVYGASGWALADVQPVDRDGEEGEANARLIAAAPELLEALRGLDEAYCRAGTGLTRDERHEDRTRLIAARAAIAKATGEQP